MGRASFLRTDFSAASTITADSQEPDAPASELLSELPRDKWRTLGVGTFQLVLDAVVAQTWQGVFLGYHNGTDTMRVTSGDTLGTLFSSPSYDSGTFSINLAGVGNFAEGMAWHRASTPQTFRYVGIEIADAANPDGYFQAGVLRVGQIIETDLEPELGSSDGFEDFSTVQRLSDGSTITRVKAQKDGIDLRWEVESEASHVTMKSLQRDYGEHTALIVKQEPEDSAYERNFLFYGRPKWRGHGTFASSQAYGYRSVSVTITEV